MAEFTLRVRRYEPGSPTGPYWQEHTVELEEHRSVLEGILRIKERFDGSLAIRCSCRAAICGSCGVRINGEPGLACKTHLNEARAYSEAIGKGGVIEVEPLGNMPVIKDLVVDMDAVHWKKVGQVTPWLIARQPVPKREYIVDRESMLDVTQTMACIQCGACVSDCLAMEADPLFIGPAALAKAYRFVGDPRDDRHRERLVELAENPHGIFECTHCFKCVQACPKEVNPMGQIMRLRRIAAADYGIVDANNGVRHEQAFATLVREHGLLHEAELLPRSYGGDSWLGKFHPAAGRELLSSLPVIVKAILRGKVNPLRAILPHRLGAADRRALKRIFSHVEGKSSPHGNGRYELNLYIAGEDEPQPQQAQAEANR